MNIRVAVRAVLRAPRALASTSLCLTCFVARPSAAEEPVRHRVALQMNLPLDISITAAGTAIWIGSELLSGKLASRDCRWCDRNSDGSDNLNSFDSSIQRHLRWSNTSQANTLSSVFSFGLAPLAGTGVAALIAAYDDRLDEIPEDLLLVAESAVITMNVAQGAKFGFARERPDVHARSAAEREAQSSTSDNLSFFSGHASLAFSLATSAGTVASMRGHRLAPLMWLAGLGFATTGAYLRVAADEHYATDVLTGSLVGSAIGFAVPYFAHRPVREEGEFVSQLRVSARPVEGGQLLVLSGLW
jgi:membrane-associated phospholipid phosphatase